MTGHGGFEHNLQSLRVVDYLEARYPAFDGLNLTFETREGVLKHCSRANAERLEAAEPQGVAHRFLARAQPSLEAQLCNLADEIAYNAHDIDDGVRSGLITMEQLQAVPLFENFRLQTLQEFPQLLEQHSHRKLLYESIRRMLSAQVYDVIRSTQEVLNAHTLPDAQAVRQCPPLVCFSAAMREQSTELKQFLYANLYRHPQVMATTAQARQVIRDLFEVYRQRHTEMPLGFAERAQQAHSEGGMLRVVADFIAGMTDRFAWREHERLTGLRLLA
jgi:dGTPase